MMCDDSFPSRFLEGSLTYITLQIPEKNVDFLNVLMQKFTHWTFVKLRVKTLFHTFFCGISQSTGK